MVCLAGVGGKNYAEVFALGRPLPEMPCPDPACAGARLRGHGRYPRYVGGVQQLLRRVRCVTCRVTHAVLPEELCAYRDVTLLAVEAAQDASAAGPTAATRAAGERGPKAVRRFTRLLRELADGVAPCVVSLLPPAAGTWMERVRQVVGTATGTLLRLRHWLWETLEIFFGGPVGLFRHGRARNVKRYGSTQVCRLTGACG